MMQWLHLSVILSSVWTATLVSGQCPLVGLGPCSCEVDGSVIITYKCDSLGTINELPYLGSSQDIIQVIKISGSTVYNIQNNSFIGLKARLLDMRSTGITNMAASSLAGLEPYLENLYLVGNVLTVLPVSIFNGFGYLRTLTLDMNRLTAIETNQFKDLTSLAHLGLDGNSITDLRSGSFQGLVSLKYLYLQRNHIEQLPAGIFAPMVNLQELNLSNNKITSLDATLFSQLPLLEHLVLSNNLIQDLPESAFDNNKKLRVIELSDNWIASQLTNGLFQGPRDLEILDLSFNNLTYFHPSTFNNLRKLKKLKLDNNKIKALSAGTFEGLDKIEEFYLQKNQLNGLPSNTFIGMPNLHIIDLSRNRIRKLTFGIFDPFGHLKKLYISRNEISDIDHGPFITLRSLEVLDISYNRLHAVTKDWFVQKDWETSSKNLKELYINNNAIRHIDMETFWPLKSLEKLDISTNRLFRLNETVFKTSGNLKEVRFHQNPLFALPEGLLSSLNKVKTLQVTGTCLTEIQANTFNGMTSLEELDLSTNFINSIYLESFAGLANISSLNISYNNITMVERSSLSDMANALERLDMHHNTLTAEGLGDNLDYVKKLKFLDLSFNQLTNLYGVSSLKQQMVLLKLKENPFHCDCNAAWVSNYITLADFEYVKCESPENLYGEMAVCFPFPTECRDAPTAIKYSEFCVTQKLVGEISISDDNSTETVEIYKGKSMLDYIEYCTEPEIIITTPSPGTGNNNEQSLPDTLVIDVSVDYRTLTVTWQYQNNSRIIGYKVGCRQFGQEEWEHEEVLVNLNRTIYKYNSMILDKNYIVCVDIILNDDSTLSGKDSCKEVSIASTTLKPSGTPEEPAKVDESEEDEFPLMPVIVTCIAVVVVLVIILAIVFLCLRSKPKEKEEDKYMNDRLRDKMGMWVNSFNYQGGINEQIAEQTTVEVDIFAPVDVVDKKEQNRKSNGHVNT